MKRREPDEDPRSFVQKQRVRIYLGHVTDTEIHVREGIVVDYRASQENGNRKKALVLRVQSAGPLQRSDPREIIVYNNASSYWVQGNLSRVKPVTREYEKEFQIRCICGAESL